MQEFLSPRARTLQAYVPGEQPKDKTYIKLNTNENPYPPSPRVAQAIAGATGSLPLYPPPEMEDLRDAIAQECGMPSRDWVYCGNGSDEVLAVAFQAFFGGDEPLLFPDITYSFYPVYCQLYGINMLQIPLGEDFRIDFSAYERPCCGVVFPNPNAPTGLWANEQEIEKVLQAHAQHVVLVDEAYAMFAPGDMAGLLQKYPNLVIVRTLSKSHSLAGIRCGYVLAHPELIKGIIAVKNSFNSYPLDAMTQAGARAAIEDSDHARKNCRRVAATRDRTALMLRRMGFTVTPSQANFLFVSHPQHDACKIFDLLREYSILVRHFNKPERIANYLRITVGTDEQMNRLVETLLRTLK